jgi:hypothetical protein
LRSGSRFSFLQAADEASASEGAAAQLKGITQELNDIERQQAEFVAKEAEIERLERVRNNLVARL